MTVCAWCGAAFAARGSGRRQRFCKARCRNGFFSAARRWAAAEVAAGRLRVETLREFQARTTCTLPGCATAGEGEEKAGRPLPNMHAE